MTGKETKIAIFVLFALLWVSGAAENGYGGSVPEFRLAGERHVRPGEVEIHRRDPGKLKMIDLCRRLEDVLSRDGANRDTEVYRESTELEGTEHRREVRESSRFLAPADEREILDLCHELEYSEP